MKAFDVRMFQDPARLNHGEETNHVGQHPSVLALVFLFKFMVEYVFLRSMVIVSGASRLTINNANTAIVLQR